MAGKRSQEEAVLDAPGDLQIDTKRPRIALRLKSDSSNASSGSTFERSAQCSTLPAVSDGTTCQSSVSSMLSDDEDIDSDSEVSSFVSETSEEANDEDDEVIELRVERSLRERDILDSEAQKLQLRLAACHSSPMRTSIGTESLLSEANSMKSRLTAFLPQIQRANAMLDSDSTTLNIEDIDEDGPHIEMDLSLGVLEEKKPVQIPSSFPVFADSDSESDNGNSAFDIRRRHSKLGASDDEPDVMRHLLGKNRPRLRPGIEELEGIEAANEQRFP